MQQQLTELNYDPGPIDGFMGRRTREAIMNFQQDNNITPTGFVDEKTMQKLKSKRKRIRMFPRPVVLLDSMPMKK